MTMCNHTLKDVFVSKVRDIRGAEKQINKALKKMARTASYPGLKEAFEEHLEQTEGQVERLQQALETVGPTARAKSCPGIAGIIEESEEAIDEAESPEVLDAMLIAGAQKVEHYEIATYGTLCTWGEPLGLTEAVKLLKQCLKQEKETDAKLTKLAMEVNRQAQTA